MVILESLLYFVLLSIVVEHLTGIVKQVLPGAVGAVQVPLLLALAFGIGTALLTKTDLFSAIGFSVAVPWVAEVMTGVALGGGSKMAHELIAKLRASRQDIETPPDQIMLLGDDCADE